ncbi:MULTISPECIES: ATP-binding cassette domain-containing protein [unclassified Pseudodesulfovibrio]|uniref:ATP-binding cassette domain-containing protein n=1 Tax=unclassified Pseudodesulfovibrio TaxID=2661612 RepID=UPI000FEBDA62|nr:MULTISPECIES: ATP-binding cassette domain-containing protein [unclassified Pseudodesulfovibrio]MCJ2163400.1 ATP-binding cassette domain-containing protein [Pseudodesulfovibrio sp. S3-i]RWU06636.1 ATP-binding cassette domain-containing protein [Pseudodesulfovibrio sp. S3]
MIIEKMTILSGTDKQGKAEPLKQVDLFPGDSLALVGPTGSGKSELLSDIEQAACGDTRSGRTILINGNPLTGTSTGLVATLSQKTNFVMDASVEQFIMLHAESRGREGEPLLTSILDMANGLCGEPITRDMSLQVLSGGQARALMIADIALLSNTPIVLIDEVENAGIHKFKALEVLAGHRKIVISATHDPVLILMNDTRLVMKTGGMTALLSANDGEREYAEQLKKMDGALMQARECLRRGQTLGLQEAM